MKAEQGKREGGILFWGNLWGIGLVKYPYLIWKLQKFSFPERRLKNSTIDTRTPFQNGKRKLYTWLENFLDFTVGNYDCVELRQLASDPWNDHENSRQSWLAKVTALLLLRLSDLLCQFLIVISKEGLMALEETFWFQPWFWASAVEEYEMNDLR